MVIHLIDTVKLVNIIFDSKNCFHSKSVVKVLQYLIKPYDICIPINIIR